MSDDYDIYQVAAAIAQENKTPTVALLKARLPKSLPLAQVIKGLQYWQNNPTPPEKKIATNTIDLQVDKEIAAYVTAQLKLAVVPLHQEIEVLQKKVMALQNELQQLTSKNKS